ncbi:monooxygenase asqM [Echria macrotheca]|uniref:Monooxygenase asqM n=1 Tax=Echria macrotheca TaxID=438768 RepID=A0AAJ0B3W6_9PEZI|nr:monooxygenase asqM [Echria macrotheca]
MSNAPKIAIVGAGPAGCMLARLLNKASIPVTVFEGEASPDYRSQGGTLDLHTSTGLAAMKEAGLFDQFLTKARYGGDHLQITDHRRKVFLVRAGQPAPAKDDAKPVSRIQEQRPEIDRADLRRILTESLPAGMVRWGHHVKTFDPATGTLTFEGDVPPATGFDLVVGADGAWSKVRLALAGDVKPIFSGVGAYELSVPDAEVTTPELHAAVKGGNLFAHAEYRRICIQQMGDGSLGVYAMLKQDNPDWASRCGYDSHDLNQVKQALLEGADAPFSDWDPLLKQAISAAQGKCTPRSMYHLPLGFRWEHCRGATLIGDAAHLMTPFAGEGVNVALEDAMKLARAIVDAVREKDGDWDEAVREFEVEMGPRAEKVARLADQLGKLWMFEKGTPGSVMGRMAALHISFGKPAIVYPLVSAITHTVFFVKGMLG